MHLHQQQCPQDQECIIGHHSSCRKQEDEAEENQSQNDTKGENISFASAFLSIMMKSSAQFCEGGNGLNVLFYLLILDMKTLDLEGYGVDFPFYCPPY